MSKKTAKQTEIARLHTCATYGNALIRHKSMLVRVNCDVARGVFGKEGGNNQTTSAQCVPRNWQRPDDASSCQQSKINHHPDVRRHGVEHQCARQVMASCIRKALTTMMKLTCDCARGADVMTLNTVNPDDLYFMWHEPRMWRCMMTSSDMHGWDICCCRVKCLFTCLVTSNSRDIINL